MRKKTTKVDIIIIAVIILLIAGVILLALLPQSTQPGNGDTTVYGEVTLSDFNGKQAGMITGSVHEQIIGRLLPDSEISVFNNTPDLIEALNSGKIDYFLANKEKAQALIKERTELAYIDIPGETLEMAAMFAKTPESDKLRGEFDAFITGLRSDGTLDEIYRYWQSDESGGKSVDMSGLEAVNGKIVLVNDTVDPPMSFISGGGYGGVEPDIIVRFCKEYGYGLELIPLEPQSMIPGLTTGIYDIGMGNIIITDERKESVNFSVPYNSGDTVLVSLKEALYQHKDISYKDYAGKTIGVGTGSMFDVLVENNIPDAKLMYFNTYSDMVTALETGKVDAVCVDEPVIKYIMATEDHAVDYIHEPIEEYNYGFAFPKTEAGKKLRDEFNEFLKKIKSDGTLHEIENKWFSPDKSSHTLPEIDNSKAEHGVLRLAAEALITPFVYLEGNRIVGYEVDIAYNFCKEYGYGLEITDMSFSAIIPALNTGMSDFGCSSMNITEERAESVYFSDPDYVAGAVLAVKTSDLVNTQTTAANKNKLVPAVTLDELNSPERKVGVATGASGMFAAEKYLPNAQVLQFDTLATAAEAVKMGQIDAYVYERSQLLIALDNGFSGVMLLDDNLGETINVAVGLSRATKINGLKDSINRFIAEKKADGTLNDMLTRWMSDKNYTMPEISLPDSPKFTLVVGTSGLVEPYSFYEGSTLTGFDIEMSRRFAAWLGADIEYKVIDYSGIIAAAQSGSVDCIFANLNVTDERKEAIDFSDTIYSIENGILVRAVSANDTVSEQSWLDSIVSSFEKNFIREERWKLIVEGIGTTCFITVMSAIFGSILAFLICMFRRTGSKLANCISNIYVKLLQGTPIVVLLMILYYVLLGKSGLEAVWVAVIGFSLNFGAYASEIMRSGIESIDGGQREAALALGYNENQAFFKFIFPQAAVRFIPVYRQEIVSLLKSTSIVGYIAIQDLTKMSDIIRSRTYEAFFPLIATAIIYFILAWVIALILKIVLKAFDKRHSAVCGKK